MSRCRWMAKTLALSPSYGCFQNYISLVFEDKQTHRDELKCLVSLQKSVQQGGGHSSIQRLTDQQTHHNFPLYTIRKHRAGDIYGYLWPMRKTSQGLRLLAFCSDCLGLSVELCTDGWTSEEFSCHKYRRYTALAAVERDLAL